MLANKGLDIAAILRFFGQMVSQTFQIRPQGQPQTWGAKNLACLVCLTLLGVVLAGSLTGQALAGSPASQAACRVPVLTGHWPPYVAETEKGYGLGARIVAEAFQAMGCQVEFRFLPWKRVEQALKNGEAFAAFPYVKTEERLASFDFSAPLLFSFGQIFYKKERFPKGLDFNALTDLRPYRVGGILGYWYEMPLKEAGLDLDLVRDDILNFKKLDAGRVDLVIADAFCGWSVLASLFPDPKAAFATLPTPLNQSSLHLMISRDYPDAQRISAAFNRALATLDQQGRIQKILRDYLPGP